MSLPVSFTPVTPNLSLPMIVPGQAQKEFFVNQALGILDALYGYSVRASLTAPPALVEEGESFRVTGPATQAWQGCDDHLAVRIGGSWHFIAPREGMLVFDRAAGQFMAFRSGWQKTTAPTVPAGGGIIDVEARAAINQLIQALRLIGIMP
jgi:hypothetical protein